MTQLSANRKTAQEWENQDERSELPENAFTPLKEGEEYEPILSPYVEHKETTLYAVLLGLFLGAIFTVAATYMPLKVGQGVTSDVPIAAIGIGLAAVLGRKKVLGENMVMQCIGSTGSMMNSGLIFVMPALFILQIQATLSQFVWTSVMGGALGIAYAIILRNYFVEHMHGRYPFPGSLATTQILLSGAQGGESLKVLIYSSIVGGAADFATNAFGWWNSAFTSRFCSLGEQLASKSKLLFALDVEAAVVAIGYMTGLRYASIIAAGSMFAWWCMVPFVNFFADGQTIAVGTNVTKLVKNMSPEEIFRNYVRFVGIGTLAMSGILGVVKMAPFIGMAFRDAIKAVFKKEEQHGTVLRTRRDVPMPWVLLAILGVGIGFALIAKFGYDATWLQAGLISAVLIFGSFLFAVVGTTSIAFTSSEPVSGLTLLTLIIGAQAMVATGLMGEAGIVLVLLMASVVCGSLFMTGCFVGDLKTAFWLGSTPHKLEKWKFVNVIISAVISGAVVLVLAKSFGFSGEGSLVAPQANAMAAVISPMMAGQEAPWMLYLIGALLAIFLDMIKVPALAFGLGVYIPLELNLPLLVGGLISYFVSSRSTDDLLNKLRHHRGVLISSGFIAGGSIMGVCSAVLRVLGYDFAALPWGHTDNPEFWALIMYIGLCSFYVLYAMKAKKPDSGSDNEVTAA